MGWAIPEYNNIQINQAGKILLGETINAPSIAYIDHAFEIINNFRSSHNFPLNTFQIRLRRIAKKVDSQSLVAQRIKRLSSIRSKLTRLNDMKLAQMQDIAGCRAIVNTLPQVNKLVGLIKKNIKHKPVGGKDYILNPKDSGYRGIHLIYRYYSDKKTTFNGLKIEIQIRTLLQHAWATAVETVDTFTRQSLKSSIGKEEWKRFFALMSTAIANREKTAIIPNTPENPDELKQELIRLEKELRVEVHLKAWGRAIKLIETPEVADVHYYLLSLDAEKRHLSVTGYSINDLNRASDDYLKLERENVDKNSDAVLVSAESLDALKRAYPNYYLDTSLFLDIVQQAIQ